MATVLVVDDEPIVREVVVRYLEREGHATLEAGDGTTARAMLEEQTADLVVLDVMLPGIDGLELCRWIRTRSALPVILLTARGEEADRIVGLDLGADDYVDETILAPRARGPGADGVAPRRSHRSCVSALRLWRHRDRHRHERGAQGRA